jgi:hypothetical protein
MFRVEGPPEGKMTEQEWLSCTYPRPLLQAVRLETNDRKARLFATACVRRIWHLLTDADRQVVELAERYADYEVEYAALSASAGNAGEGQPICNFGPEVFEPIEAWRKASEAVAAVAERTIWVAMTYTTASTRAAEAAAEAARPETPTDLLSAHATEEAAQARLVRCLFRYPWKWPDGLPRWLRWQSGIIPRMAQAAYEQRRLPAGLLDNALLTVLADALDEAGCDDPAMLLHLRDGGQHIRGCWVLDQLLNRS